MVALTLGCLFSDRIEALLDGRVGLDGFDLSIRIVEAQTLFRQVLRSAAFDVAELSMASHIAAVGQGKREYVGLPVFPSRSFRHSNLYVRTYRVHEPADLGRRRIGLIEYQQTAALWVRGILADDHGVAREDVKWIAAGLHAPVTEDRMPVVLPAGIRYRRSADTLDAMLRAGELDAIISPTAPRCFVDPDVPVARMWPDVVTTERDWWTRTGLFPIMHVLVVRRAPAEAHPTLPALLCDAFERARALAAADLVARDFPKVALPWLPAFAAEALAALDGDPWTYGLDANRSTIETMLDHAAADGLTPRRLGAEDLFA